MDKIFIQLNNCHGINKFSHDFVFKKVNSNLNANLILVYASNGTMKTSFAKTLRDLGNGETPKNIISEKEPSHTIWIENDNERLELNSSDLIKERIFVIESLKSEFKFNETAPLISDVHARNEYESISKVLHNKKIDLLNKIKDKTKISIPNNDGINYIEDIINNDFKNEFSNFLDFLLSLKEDFSEDDLDKFDPININLIKYDDLFNDKVFNLYKDEEFIKNIDNYSLNLDNLLSKSKIFDRDNFTHNNANDLFKNIKKNNLFKAGHKLKFKSKGTAIDNIDDLNQLYDEQYKKIFEEDSLRNEFDKINKKLNKNAKTRTLGKLILDSPDLIPRLNDFNKLKRDYWYSIFNYVKEDLLSLIYEYELKKPKLGKIIKDARDEETKWNKILNIFNNRFEVPFKLELSNKEDIILKSEIPKIEFYFEDNNGKSLVSLKELINIVSAGQLRSLYLLDILYQIEMKRKNDKTVLLVFDDIADSFDYQNKYAIIEYLKDLADDDSFRILLLTHNYDFFRTVKSRINCANCYIANKNVYDIKLEKYLMNNNIFVSMVNAIKNKEKHYCRKIIALIPFIRNLSEYNQDFETKEQMTYLLHFKDEGKNLTFSDLKKAYCKWKIVMPDNLTNKNVYDSIFKEACSIFKKNKRGMDIENKIVLSIAIRLKMEIFIFRKLNNFISKEDITRNQTRFLLDKYKEHFGNDKNVEVFEKVVMMTPENIHINSFMFEPILDMDEYYLRDLYSRIWRLEND